MSACEKDARILGRDSSAHAGKGNIDVAVNIFAKPFQTALALLSLWKHCARHIGKIWLQFEPAGSRYDKILPYHIAAYLAQELGIDCEASQPEEWLERAVAKPERFQDSAYRLAIRYQNAFEASKADKLFIMHNDIVVLKDVIGAMNQEIGNAFAIGQLGQCWNCPAANAGLMKEALDQPPCTPDTYADFRPDYPGLCRLYSRARGKGIFVRDYAKDYDANLAEQPWPLPECRINEWACLVNLKMVRSLTIPAGTAFPFGAFKQCGSERLDTAVAWFRDLHKQGLKAKNFAITKYVKHWVGTGNKSAHKYTLGEERALQILRRSYPAYLIWLSKKTGKDVAMLCG